jgi:AraC-like DNA-binding protein
VDLAKHVACFWTTRYEVRSESDHLPATDRVLPDACLDVLFDLARGEAMLVGTMTRPLAVALVGSMNLLGVRFRVGGIGAVLRLPAYEITDGAIPLDAVWGARARALARRVTEATTTTSRIALVETELRRHLAASRGTDALVHAAAGLVERAGGSVRVDTLANATGLGPRQLERRFLAAVGLPPKFACRVLRFQAAVGFMHGLPGMALSRVALDAGYHDQAHLTRDFRLFAGEPPGAYRRRRGLDVVSVQDGASGQR